MSMTEALEWYDQNMHCNYPLSQDSSVVSSSGVYLPSSFLVDINLLLPELGIANLKNRVFVSKIERGLSDLVVYLSLSLTGEDVEIARTEAIPLVLRSTDAVADRTFSIVPTASAVQRYEQLARLSGELVIGTCLDMGAAETLTFSFAAAKVVSPRITVASSGLDHVTVVGADGAQHVLYNDFTIEAGDGIDFSVTSSGGVYTVHISRVDTEEETTSQYSSVDEVVDAVIQALGNPIRAINGVAPDSTGNIVVTGGDCLDVTGVSGGLFMANPCSKPCCDTSSIADVQNALSQLEQARSRLETYYITLTNNVNALQSRLSALIAAG